LFLDQPSDDHYHPPLEPQETSPEIEALKKEIEDLKSQADSALAAIADATPEVKDKFNSGNELVQLAGQMQESQDSQEAQGFEQAQASEKAQDSDQDVLDKMLESFVVIDENGNDVQGSDVVTFQQGSADIIETGTGMELRSGGSTGIIETGAGGPTDVAETNFGGSTGIIETGTGIETGTEMELQSGGSTGIIETGFGGSTGEAETGF
jgi:hypothetical protein